MGGIGGLLLILLLVFIIFRRKGRSDRSSGDTDSPHAASPYRTGQTAESSFGANARITLPPFNGNPDVTPQDSYDHVQGGVLQRGQPIDQHVLLPPEDGYGRLQFTAGQVVAPDQSLHAVRLRLSPYIIRV